MLSTVRASSLCVCEHVYEWFLNFFQIIPCETWLLLFMAFCQEGLFNWSSMMHVFSVEARRIVCHVAPNNTANCLVGVKPSFRSLEVEGCAYVNEYAYHMMGGLWLPKNEKSIHVYRFLWVFILSFQVSHPCHQSSAIHSLFYVVCYVSREPFSRQLTDARDKPSRSVFVFQCLSNSQLICTNIECIVC